MVADYEIVKCARCGHNAAEHVEPGPHPQADYFTVGKCQSFECPCEKWESADA